MEPSGSEYPVEIAADAVGDFVHNYFTKIDLGHLSRDACFRKVATRISRHPGGTLPDKLGSPARYAAMDRLMNRPETTHAAILGPHFRSTWAKMEASDGVVLILHDTTVLDYSGLNAAKLAKVGNGHGRGYLCHNSLAVDPQRREVFGLVSQILHQRVSPGKKEPVAVKRGRASRESRLWSRAVLDLAAAPPGRRYIDVADRGADLFEFLFTEQRLGRECLVRSTSNRCVRLGHDGQGKQTLLHDHLRTLAAVGKPRSKTIRDSQKQERTAVLRVSYAAIEILPPHVKKGDYENKPIPAWAVRVWEETPPEGEMPLEWFLIVLYPVVNADDAWQQCDWYSCRWMVEEYHKAKKTGCQIEDLQFHTEEALQPMVALLSVVAVMLLNLREAARRPDAATRPATAVVEPIYEEVIRKWRHGNKPHEPFTVLEFYMAVARLGGHMNRKGDGFPGWLTLWRGWQKLQLMVEAAANERGSRLKIV